MSRLIIEYPLDPIRIQGPDPGLQLNLHRHKFRLLLEAIHGFRVRAAPSRYNPLVCA